MVTFADIAEYLYEECQSAESDGKEVYPLYKKRVPEVSADRTWHYRQPDCEQLLEEHSIVRMSRHYRCNEQWGYP